MNIEIRLEAPADYEAVENLNRDAFWNVFQPGCNEHYLVHVMRAHEDFVPELALVAEVDGKLVGNIMYTMSTLKNDAGEEKKILTFGPLAVHPGYQRRGIGKMLMQESFERAKALGYEAVVIMGNPENYVGSGFRACLDFKVCMADGSFPMALLVRELKEGSLGGQRWVYSESPLFQIDAEAAEQFEKTFPARERGYTPSQELFAIYSRAYLHPAES